MISNSINNILTGSLTALTNQAKSASKDFEGVFKNLDKAEKGMQAAIRSCSPEQMFNAQENFKKANQAFEMMMAMRNAINKMIDSIIENMKRIGQ